MEYPDNHGIFLGVVNVCGFDLEVFSNGCSKFAGDLLSCDNEGYYLGLKFQCVELVRRFLYFRYGINFANVWSDGDAKDWFFNRKKMNLREVGLSEVQVGDIICMQGGKWGHIAIVSEVFGSGISIVSQNFQNDEKDLDFYLSKSFLKGDSIVKDHNDFDFIFEGFLRFDKDTFLK